MNPKPAQDALAAAARDILIERGPLPEDELLDALAVAGFDTGLDRPWATILDDHREPVFALADDRFAWIPAVLDGRVFTHRLTDVEATHDVLAWHPDLAPLSMLADGEAFARLADGAPIDEVHLELGEDFGDRDVPESFEPAGGVLVLPAGRFADLGATAGDLIGLRVTEDGLALEKVESVDDGEALSALTAVLAKNPEEPQPVDIAVWTACCDDDSVFRDPTTPLGDLLAGAEFARSTFMIAPAGFDFESWREAGRLEMIQYRYELTDDEARALSTVIRVLDLHEPTPGGMPLRTALGYLAQPFVAAALFEHAADGDDRGVETLRQFTETVERDAPRPARPALLWLRAKAAEILGDVLGAEAALEAAESLDPDWPLTLMSLARYAADRGDAERGLALLRRAGVPDDHELVAVLERFRPTARAGLGRNERCWCGSGRKYKVCHLNREQSALEDRASWLYSKAAMDLAGGEFSSMLLEAAAERSSHWDDPDALAQATDDELVCDAVLFEGGAFEEFLELRGVLLPDDERLLAQQWLLVERSVHEVVAVQRGEGMTLRDVRTGDVVDVRERRGSAQVEVGQLYCARVVPAGDTMQIFGGLHPVSIGERDELLALLDEGPDPLDLVAFLSRRFAPTALVNTEGEPLALCESTLRIDDPPALIAALDDTYGPHEQDPDGARVWCEYILTDGLERIRAQLDLSGDLLHVNTNSEIRLDRVLAVVGGLAPSAAVVEETREPAGDFRAMQQILQRRPGEGQPILDPAEHPEVAAALDDFTRRYEQDWLDKPIPALAGCTPRQCAEDPTRRDDLIRLLDSFPPDTGHPGSMSVARLRAALGL